MNTKPLVSVLMPVYNEEKYLAAAIESILNQTFNDFEFIIIDDCSTDETWAILNRYTDPRLLLIQNKENLGHTKSLNKALAHAQGKYLARMDGDDISLPTRFSSQVKYMEEHPEIGVLGTGFLFMDKDGNTTQTVQFPTQHGVLKWCLFFYDPIVHPSVMMRRGIVEEAEGYNSDLRYAEDYDLWRRLSCVAHLSNLPDVLLHLRKHAANVSILHEEELWKYSIQTCNLMISQIINEKVSVMTIQRLWDNNFKTVSDVRSVAELVYKIYKSVVSDEELSTVEKRTIRKDAALKLYCLTIPWVKSPCVWGGLFRVCYLDPLFPLRLVKRFSSRHFTRLSGL
ncbi:MAG: glycosyltransferase [Mariniphaga sp.]